MDTGEASIPSSHQVSFKRISQLLFAYEFPLRENKLLGIMQILPWNAFRMQCSLKCRD